MAEFMDFDAATDEDTGEASTFELNGRTWHVAPDIPMGTILEVGKIAAMSTDDIAATEGLMRVVSACVVPEETVDFAKALNTLGVVKFWKVSAWIVEVISGRPLEQLLALQSSEQPTTGPSSSDSSTGDTTGTPGDSPPVSAST